MSGEGRVWDVAVVGAGPGGLFAAAALAGKLSVLVLDEKGRTGGAGAMTDGKLNLSPHIGLDLAELAIGEEEALERIARIDEAFLRHGADPTVYGEDRERIGTWLDRVSWARRRTRKGEWDITLLPARQRHMGPDMANRVVARMTETLASAGVEFSLRTRVETVRRRSGGPFVLRTSKGEYFARYVLAAPGRDGAYWFREEARGLGVATRYGAIDIGCRVEVASPVYEEITRVLYDRNSCSSPRPTGTAPDVLYNPGGR
jgi:hypothetical protein